MDALNPEHLSTLHPNLDDLDIVSSARVLASIETICKELKSVVLHGTHLFEELNKLRIAAKVDVLPFAAPIPRGALLSEAAIAQLPPDPYSAARAAESATPRPKFKSPPRALNKKELSATFSPRSPLPAVPSHAQQYSPATASRVFEAQGSAEAAPVELSAASAEEALASAKDALDAIFHFYARAPRSADSAHSDRATMKRAGFMNACRDCGVLAVLPPAIVDLAFDHAAVRANASSLSPAKRAHTLTSAQFRRALVVLAEKFRQLSATEPDAALSPGAQQERDRREVASALRSLLRDFFLPKCARAAPPQDEPALDGAAAQLIEQHSRALRRLYDAETVLTSRARGAARAVPLEGFRNIYKRHGFSRFITRREFDRVFHNFATLQMEQGDAAMSYGGFCASLSALADVALDKEPFRVHYDTAAARLAKVIDILLFHDEDAR